MLYLLTTILLSPAFISAKGKKNIDELEAICRQASNNAKIENVGSKCACYVRKIDEKSDEKDIKKYIELWKFWMNGGPNGATPEPSLDPIDIEFEISVKEYCFEHLPAEKERLEKLEPSKYKKNTNN